MKLIALLISLIHATTCLYAQIKTDKWFKELLEKNSDKLGTILQNPDKYRLQIIYTQINRNKKNQPRFKTYYFRVDKNEYFYPASTVKFPATLLALEKLNQLNINNLDKKSVMMSDSVYQGQIKQWQDPTHVFNGGLPTIEHYIKKILLVSDNDAYNRLYEFVGQEKFNTTLYEKGYKNLRIIHRLSVPMSREQNKRSNSIRFFKSGEKSEQIVYQQPMLISAQDFAPAQPILLGKGYIGKNDALVNEPFDFTYKNYFALEDQQAILRGVLFPESVPPKQRFGLRSDDYQFLYKYMSMSPLESKCPVYPDTEGAGGWDSYCKFVMFGDNKKSMPKNIRIFNKVGDAYGFLLDNAYIVDFDNHIEFMLSAVIYCNEDGIFNDDKYEYDQIGFPFLAKLGQVLYEFEKNRPKKIKPDLSKFKINYDQQD